MELLALGVGQFYDTVDVHDFPAAVRAVRLDYILPFMSTPPKREFIEKQGQYLAFIYLYTKLNKQPPAQADLQRYFEVTPPTIHSMLVRLHELRLISRQRGRPRSIAVLVPPDVLPPLR